jgi:Flp pilus assembly protein TadG
MKTKTDMRNERGQTMTEFALVVPVLLLVLFAIIQFGMIFKDYVTLTDAARAGARTGAVSRLSVNPSAVCVNQVNGAATTLNLANLTVTCTSPWTPGSDVTVSASYPYNISLLGWVVASGQLNTTMKERVE